jgi:hypothetical protein
MFNMERFINHGDRGRPSQWSADDAVRAKSGLSVFTVHRKP